MNTTTQTVVTPAQVDIRPNWQGLCRLYVLAARSGDKNYCGQEEAMRTVMKASRIADAVLMASDRGLLSAEAKAFIASVVSSD